MLCAGWSPFQQVRVQHSSAADVVESDAVASGACSALADVVEVSPSYDCERAEQRRLILLSAF